MGDVLERIAAEWEHPSSGELRRALFEEAADEIRTLRARLAEVEEERNAEVERSARLVDELTMFREFVAESKERFAAWKEYSELRASLKEPNDERIEMVSEPIDRETAEFVNAINKGENSDG